MKIVTNLPAPAGAWKRAGAFLGHEVAEVVASRPFDAARRLKPELLLLDADSPLSERLRADCPTAKAVFTRVKPALDALPGWTPGRRREEYACEAAYFGPYDPFLDEALVDLLLIPGRFRIYGPGAFPVPNVVGEVPAVDLWDAYASAGCVFDLRNDPNLALDVIAAGGACLPLKPYVDTGVPALDGLPHGLEWVFTVDMTPPPEVKLTKSDTYVARLEELLEC